ACAQGMADGCKLDPDRPTAHDENVPGQPPSVQDRVRVADARVVEGDVPWPCRPRAGGDQDGPGTQRPFAAIGQGHDNGSPRPQASAALKVLDVAPGNVVGG